MDGTLEQVRAWYADDLRVTAPVDSASVVQAFASVPRERFMGPGPWRLRSDTGRGDYRTSPNDDPRWLYHNVLVALDEARRINNGSPALWAYVLDQLALTPGERVLHLGCGTGYYSAVMAELVGSRGCVTAVEYLPHLAARAREALAAWPHVKAIQVDGANYAGVAQDAVVVSAGATHPLPSWIAALQRPGARLVFPLTSTEAGGVMLLVTRGEAPLRHAARALCRAWFVPFQGGRDAALDAQLALRMRDDSSEAVRSLRLDPHAQESDCWLHGDGFCLSRLNGDHTA